MLFILLLFFYNILPALLFFFFFFNDTATTEIYPLSLHDALPISNRASKIVLELGHGAPLAGRSPESVRIEPVEIEWKRKNGTTLKARLSGRGSFDEHGDFDGYEIIAVDITEQRALEEQLRHQVFIDSLTGLANHRRLFGVLQAEIGRTKATG